MVWNPLLFFSILTNLLFTDPINFNTLSLFYLNLFFLLSKFHLFSSTCLNVPHINLKTRYQLKTLSLMLCFYHNWPRLTQAPLIAPSALTIGSYLKSTQIKHQRWDFSCWFACRKKENQGERVRRLRKFKKKNYLICLSKCIEILPDNW